MNTGVAIESGISILTCESYQMILARIFEFRKLYLSSIKYEARQTHTNIKELSAKDMYHYRYTFEWAAIISLSEIAFQIRLKLGDFPCEEKIKDPG